MPFEQEREMFTTTCGDCGNECQVPFKPKEDRPVYCNECFPNHKPTFSKGGSRFGRRSRFGRGSRNERPREMFPATCGDCGNECKVPFKPKEDRPVYCNECFPNHK